MSARTHDAISEPVPGAPRRPLLSVDEALARLLRDVAPLGDRETVATMTARGRVLATSLRSRLDVPVADNAQMDGYAIRAADLAGAGAESPVVLPVVQRIPAGHVGLPLDAGRAARIFTGAPMPVGADAVVMQEAVTVDANAGTVAFSHAARSRRVGPPPWRGHPQRPDDPRGGHPARTAASRARRIDRHRRAQRVPSPARGDLLDRDELAMPGEVAVDDLKPGTLFNSNRFTLRDLIEALGCDVIDLGIVPDTLAATRDALVRAATRSDCIVTSGGVSVGEEDHIRPAVAAEGTIDSWQIAIKPGKPLAFGRVRSAGQTALFVGLPGNPVSGFVTFLMFVRPLLMRLQGIVDTVPNAWTLRADFEWARPDARQEYLRVRSTTRAGSTCSRSRVRRC